MSKTGGKILTSKLITSEVKQITTTTLTFLNEEPIVSLQQLEKAYPKAAIFLSGELVIDFSKDVKMAIEPYQFITASVIGNTIKFTCCPLKTAIALLLENRVVGTVQVKIVQLQKKDKCTT
jgi:hypothetical protein